MCVYKPSQNRKEIDVVRFSPGPFFYFRLYFFSDMPVWSKLETGRIPQPSELFQIIDSQLGFGKKPGDIDHLFENIPT